LLLDPLADQAGSLRESERYAASFEDADDALGLSEALNLIGTILFWRGRVAACEESFARSIEYARRAADDRQAAEALPWMALATAEGPVPAADGVSRLRSVLEEAQGDHRVEISVARNRAVLESMLDRPDEARALIARAKVRARELGDHVALAGTLRNSGYVEMLAGDVAAAERELREGYELLERVSDFGHLASHAPDLGDTVYELGRYDEAFRISEFAEGITIEGDVDAEVRWRQLRGKALARAERHDDALAVALEAVRIVASTEFLDLHAHAVMALAEVHQLAGRTAEAAAAGGDGLELYRKKGNLVGERRARAFLDELRA
jgi:tetratricopeptide (TPR) repeat protein